MHAGDGAAESRGRNRPAKRRARRAVTPWALIVAGAVLVAAVGAWQLYATLWTAHSERAGKVLVHRFLEDHALGAPVRSPRSSAATATTASLAACGGSHRGTPVHGLLEIPALGVVAPVEQGDGDGVLAVAVGHDPYSAWPGDEGNAVLLAHDVSYFSTIDRLASGDTVRYVTPCTTYVFRVTSHAVVTAGSPVYDTKSPTMTLVTCWPTDALWFTPDRYLVTADEVSNGPTGSSRHDYLASARSPRVPVPPALASQGVTLATYSLPMGTLALAGSPDRSWAQSTSPLLVETSGVEAFIAGVRALGEDHLDWWHEIAPGVVAPAPLLKAENPRYLSATDVTEDVSDVGADVEGSTGAEGTTGAEKATAGAGVTAVILTDTVSVRGGRDPGRYTMEVRELVRGGTLTISSWTTTPA